MKISKKLTGSMIIIGIACFTLFPKEAIAKEGSCRGVHIYKTTDSEYSETTITHPYLCGTIEQEDATEEYVYQDCTIDITIDRFEQQCEKCGKVLTQQGSGEKWTHSDHE